MSRAWVGVSVLALLLAPRTSAAQAYLPGTQPGERGIEFAKLRQCALCHSARKPVDYLDPHGAWETGMMAHAGQDPVFQAALEVANTDLEGAGGYCLRCHTPRGWIEGRAWTHDLSALEDEDLRGITCDICHRMVDPRAEEAARFVAKVPPGYGNAMMVIDDRFVVRGPYEEQFERDGGLHPHENVRDPFQSSSALCGTCHDFSNPFQVDDPVTKPPHSYAPLVRTYSEWAASAFAKEGPDATCQGCHYPHIEGGSQASRYSSPHRDHFVRMGALGGATWTKEAVAHLYRRDADADALAEGARRSRAYLKTAAALRLTVTEGKARLRVTNLTGHKLPTGYPEGTRMWISMRFLGANGAVLDEKGVFKEQSVRVLGERVAVPTLIDPDETTVYEVWSGMTDAQAAKFGKEPGRSFHFILNDTILKDNRIPPRGFTNRAFAARNAQPVGATYRDWQHYDIRTFDVPEGTQRVEARLMYQSASWEYVRFLIRENGDKPQAKRLWDVYRDTGMCPPEVVAEASADLD